MDKKISSLLSACVAAGCCWGQLLKNPSFNGINGYDAQISGWEWCNSSSTPDIQPNVWGVNTPAQEGTTYVGLTCLGDGTWEGIAQQFSAPLQAGQCYKLSLYLARSNAYAGYNKPARLRIWGGNSANDRKQLLCSSPTIEHDSWREYQLDFVPLQGWKYLILECYYKEPSLAPYRGNILIDNLQGFFSCTRA